MSVLAINEEQLLSAFEYLNVKEAHKAALTDVFLNGMTSYEAEAVYGLSAATIRPKVRRIELYVKSAMQLAGLGR